MTSAHTAIKGFIGARRSPWFSELGQGRLRCELCPKACQLAPGERGLCRVRENRAGKGVSLVYGAPGILQLDPIERKPFYHVLPGSRSLSLSTAGCNFDCKFCEVWDTVLVDPESIHAYDVPPGDVVRFAREAGARSVAFTFGEPVVFFEYMYDTARLAREAGLRTLLHSNGYINPEPLRQLCEVLDGANIDLKGFDADFYRDICRGELAPVLETLKTLHAAKVHLELTTLLIPTLNDRVETVREMTRWIYGQFGPEIPLHFSRFYPLYQLTNLPPTPISSLDAARDTAMAEGLDYVYLAGVPGHAGEHTRCPACNTVLIERLGFMIENCRLTDGRCEACGQVVPGLWH